MPKLVVEQIKDKFQEFAKDVFDTVAEPTGLALIVTWEVGKADFPPGFMTARKKSADIRILQDMLAQLNTMSLKVMDIYRDALENLEERSEKLLDTLEVQQNALHKLTKEVEFLAQRKSILEGKTT